MRSMSSVHRCRASTNSLSDEQKARFDHIAPRAPRRGQAAQGDITAATIRGQCDAGMMAWPTDQIDRVVRPDDAQRAKLQALQSAASQAADTIKGACRPKSGDAAGAVAAVGQRLQAMLRGVETMQPALADFYNSLSDDQKSRFNSMGRQLFAQSEGTAEASNAYRHSERCVFPDALQRAIARSRASLTRYGCSARRRQGYGGLAL